MMTLHATIKGKEQALFFPVIEVWLLLQAVPLMLAVLMAVHALPLLSAACCQGMSRLVCCAVQLWVCWSDLQRASHRTQQSHDRHLQAPAPAPCC
jgi:hypothetical protein